MIPRPALVLAALAALAGSSAAQTPMQDSPSGALAGARRGSDKPLDKAWASVPGYLAKGEAPDTFTVLPQPPTPGSKTPWGVADEAAYRATRKLKGTPRWDLATRDADESAAAAAADFDCVLGLDLTPETAPRTLALLTRVRTDAGQITTYAKNRFQHPRPFVSYGGPICTEDDRRGLAHSWSYPSGHTTMSWAYGLILTELAPDLAGPISARARAYGESRVVCGVHTVSDIDLGRTNASILVAYLHAKPEFARDLEAAKAEMAALRARDGSVPAYRQCAVEREAMARTPWLPPHPAPPANPGPPPKG